MDPKFIPKKGYKKYSDSCSLYEKVDGEKMKIKLNIHSHSFFFYFFNQGIPPSTAPLVPTELTNEQYQLVFHCVLMSFLAYEDRSKIIFPDDIQIVCEEFESSISKIPFFIVVDKEVNSIIISCRGSSCTDDFITDSMGNGINFDGGKIHQGIFNTATYVFLQIQNKILELNSVYNGENIEHANEGQNIRTNKEEQPNDLNNSNDENDNSEKKNKMKIIVTGHSLGAGVASIVAHLFKREFPKLDVQCICFAPPPTVSFNLWEKSTKYIQSFMIEGDMVPFLSVQNIIKFSQILFPDDRLIRRFIEKYLKKMSTDEVSDTFLKEKLYPPGQLFLIRLPQTNPIKSKKSKKEKLTKKEKDEMKKKNYIKPNNISLCLIFNPEYFSNFVKNIQESNHKCKNYMKAIIRLRQQQIQEQNCQKNIHTFASSKDENEEEDGIENVA